MGPEHILTLLLLTFSNVKQISTARAGIRVNVHGYGVIDQSDIKVTHREPGKLYQLYLKQQAEKQKIAKFKELIEKKKHAEILEQAELSKQKQSVEDEKKLAVKSYTQRVQHKKLHNPEKEARLKRMKSKSEIIDYKIGELQHNLVWAELDANLFETGERSRLVKRKTKSDFDRNIKQLETTKRKWERRYWKLKKRKRSEGSEHGNKSAKENELSRKSRRHRLRRRGLLKKSKNNRKQKNKTRKEGVQQQNSSSTRRRRRKNRKNRKHSKNSKKAE